MMHPQVLARRVSLARRPLLRTAFGVALAAALCGRAHAESDARTLRVGVLKFGTVAWELDVIARHGLAPGLDIRPVGLATAQAAQTALQAGAVDMIVQDWLWVARLRASGQDWTFAPFFGGSGALMAPADGPVRSLSDLPGRRLGVAGSPLDKNWLILRALGTRHGLDLAHACAPSFAAPPLLSEQLRQGRLDAVLTYWPEAARLRAAGLVSVLSVQQAMAELGVGERVPLTGYVFSAAWGDAHRAALRDFLAAGTRAQALLGQSDAEWEALAKLTGASGPAELAALRDAYRTGIPGPFDPATEAAVGRLYDVLAATGGKALVGGATSIPPGTFWSPAT